MQRRFFLSLIGLALAGSQLPAAAGAPAEISQASSAPPLMLANVYRSGVVLADYWVSEKYDGVRGYWDGQLLWTRGGERVAAPGWFTAGWPKVAMDGELWAGHGQFAKAVSTVRQQTPNDSAWRAMRFMVFDLPAQGGPFTERIPALNGVVSRIDQPWVQAVAQFKVASPQALQVLLIKTVKNGGEGLMLHRGASLYKGQRTDDLLKLKTHEDNEARVVAHIPGNGKYAGKLGALLLEMPAADGQPAQRFKLGTGFSDAQRQNPPAVGSRVTYRFRGLNDSGIPRFASFLRVRED
ncbi:MAG: DNA ligase [Pseudomonadota bacterium]|nr:DNA ligase [Pseudomonadota bacterium]